MGPLQRAISCVTDAVFTVGGGYHPSEHPHVLLLNNSDPVPLAGTSNFSLRVLQEYVIVEASGDRGPWKVSTRAYIYSLRCSEGREVIGYHWHPKIGVPYPHMHIRSDVRIGPRDLHNYHLPTGRVALEQVLRQAIKELKVAHNRDDWEEVLDDTQAAYEKYRTWSTTRPQQMEERQR